MAIENSKHVDLEKKHRLWRSLVTVPLRCERLSRKTVAKSILIWRRRRKVITRCKWNGMRVGTCNTIIYYRIFIYESSHRLADRIVMIEIIILLLFFFFHTSIRVLYTLLYYIHVSLWRRRCVCARMTHITYSARWRWRRRVRSSLQRSEGIPPGRPRGYRTLYVRRALRQDRVSSRTVSPSRRRGYHFIIFFYHYSKRQRSDLAFVVKSIVTTSRPSRLFRAKTPIARRRPSSRQIDRKGFLVFSFFFFSKFRYRFLDAGFCSRVTRTRTVRPECEDYAMRSQTSSATATAVFQVRFGQSASVSV